MTGDLHTALGEDTRAADARYASSRARAAVRPSQRDVLLALVLAAAFATVSFMLSGMTLRVISLDSEQWNDVFYEADLYRTFGDATERWSNHSRSNVHPLYTLATYPATFVLQHAVGISAVLATRIVLALVAGLWIVAVFALLRARGARTVDAIVFSALAASSGAAVFWFAVPETYAFGSLSIVVMLLVASLPLAGGAAEGATTVASAATLSFTITNWFVGLAATWLRYPLKSALQISVNAFCLVVLLWGVEKAIFPSATFFLDLRGEAAYADTAYAGTGVDIARSFVFHSFLVPAPRQRTRFAVKKEHPRLTVQFSRIAEGVPLGYVPALAWVALLALGALSIARDDRGFAVLLGACVLMQFCLHLVYGEETFLYSLHFLPMLLLIAASGAAGRQRVPVVATAAVLACWAAFNNVHQLIASIALLHG